MRSMRAREIVAALTSSLGFSGGEDLSYYWLEEAMTLIREKPWAWNWKVHQSLTYAPTGQAGATYTWTEGNTYILSSVAVTIPFTAAGRKVKLGEEWYLCTDFGFSTADRIVVDRPIRSSETDGVELEFVRWDIAVPTTRIRDVRINGQKVPRYSPTHFMQHFSYGALPEQMEVGAPLAYRDNESKKLAAPAFPPQVTNSGVVLASFPAGLYEYFYTRLDVESGLESHPGPSATYNAPAGVMPRVQYLNPTTMDSAEEGSWALCLYRSPVNCPRDRKPMFRIQLRDPAVPAAPFDDSYVTVQGRQPYWDGQYAVVDLLPPADSERRSVLISHLHNWYYRAYEEEYLSLGVDNQVFELLRIFFAGVVNLAGRNTPEYRQAIVQFRHQLSYLVTSSREAGSTDYGPDNYVPLVAGSTVDGDWVEQLSWRDDW